jgi:hypothetical protein
MVVNSTVLIALVILIGATVPSFAEEEPKHSREPWRWRDTASVLLRA